ncbi:MAG: hypothetical protein OEU46_03410 [Alphaproteobacteria bacterium]|nr:hypothetical protein [Alphaproteobacteria bacterium]
MFVYWRKSLVHFLGWFENLRQTTRYFYPKTFAIFGVLNLVCYWWALLTTYPNLLLSHKALEYVLTGFPVSVLGAVFDCLSLLVTVYIVRRAIASNSNTKYISYLSVDLLIAVVASMWVLLVFMVSGWVVSLILQNPETMASRTDLYQGRLHSAFTDPFSPTNLRNIYFGVVMGATALLPTLLHVLMALRSFLRSGAVMLGLVRNTSD